MNDRQTRQLLKQLNDFFESMVAIPRIRRGQRQTLETLINEEAYLFAKYLRARPILTSYRCIHSYDSYNLISARDMNHAI